MNDIFKDIRKLSTADIKKFIEREFNGDANAKYQDATVLHFAATCAGNAEVVKVLVSMGANVNAKVFDGWTPLHNAKDTEITRALVSLGANVNAKTDDGFTPLYQALNFKNIEVAKALIGMGADVNISEKNGFTPLHMAVFNLDSKNGSNIEMAKLLIPKGANVYARSRNDSCTPLDLAKQKKTGQ